MSTTQTAPTIDLHDGERLLSWTDAVDHMTMWWDATRWFPFVESEHGDITGPGHQDDAAFVAAVLGYYQTVDPEGVPDHDEMAARLKHRWLLIACTDSGDWRCLDVPEGTAGAIPVTTIWELS